MQLGKHKWDSSELGVGGGVEASCDEEHSELVVGGVAVASGGASA